MRSRRSRLLVLLALLLPAAGLGVELLPHAHPAFEEDRVGHEVAVAIGEAPCRRTAHWDATEPLHHPACAACAWVARPCDQPVVVAPVPRPEPALAALFAGRREPLLERARSSARGRAPPHHAALAA